MILIVSKEGKRVLEKINLPINLLRISVGVENIDEIKKKKKSLRN